MLEDKKYADVKIKTRDGKEISVNSLILSRSPILDDAFKKRDPTKSLIIAVSKNYETMKEVVHYLYTDEVPKMKEMAFELLAAADHFHLPGLLQKCIVHLKTNPVAQSELTMKNFSTVLVASEKFGIPALKDSVGKFINENHNEVFASDDWKALKETHFKLTMEIMEKCFSDMNKNKKK